MKFALVVTIEAQTAAQAERTANKIRETLPEGSDVQAMGLRTSWFDHGRQVWVRDE